MTRLSLILLSCALMAPACSSTTKNNPGSDGCTPSEFRCKGDELQQCDADGIAFEVQLRCIPGTCIDGQASCPVEGGGASSGGVSGNASGSSGGGLGTTTTSGGSGGVGGSSDSTGGTATTSGSSGGVGGSSDSTGGTATTSGNSGGVGGSSDSTGGTATTSGSSGGMGGSSGGSGGTTTTSGNSGGVGGTTTTSGSLGGVGGTATTSSGSGGVGGATSSMSSTGEPPPFCSPNPCPSDRWCDEAADECVCDGCAIGANCVEAGAQDPSNSCEVCDPDRNTSAYSADVGAACGPSSTECSGQDTCDGSAVCQANHAADRTDCADGNCEGGVCRASPFDCVVPDPPTIVGDDLERVGAGGSPPTPTGGGVPSGRYTPVRVQYYGEPPTTTNLYSFEVDGIFVQVASQPYPPWIPQIEFAGMFATVDQTLQFDLERCDPQYSIDVPSLEYSATANGMLTFETDAYGTRVVISYVRD